MIIDYDQTAAYLRFMEDTIAISEFKATCLAVLERVRVTGRAVVITKRGVPVARVVPPVPAAGDASWLGSMRDTATIVGDLVEPVAPAEEWEALGP
jgi:prevent-host-death family protein